MSCIGLVLLIHIKPKRLNHKGEVAYLVQSTLSVRVQIGRLDKTELGLHRDSTTSIKPSVYRTVVLILPLHRNPDGVLETHQETKPRALPQHGSGKCY